MWWEENWCASYKWALNLLILLYNFERSSCLLPTNAWLYVFITHGCWISLALSLPISEMWLMSQVISKKIKKWNGIVIKFDSLPWDIADEHPITIFVLVAWDILRTIQEIHELALVHEIYHSLCSIVSLKFIQDIQKSYKFMCLYHYIYIYYIVKPYTFTC